MLEDIKDFIKYKWYHFKMFLGKLRYFNFKYEWHKFWFKFIQTTPDHLIRFGDYEPLGHYEFRWQRLFNIIITIIAIITIWKIYLH